MMIATTSDTKNKINDKLWEAQNELNIESRRKSWGERAAKLIEKQLDNFSQAITSLFQAVQAHNNAVYEAKLAEIEKSKKSKKKKGLFGAVSDFVKDPAGTVSKTAKNLTNDPLSWAKDAGSWLQGFGKSVSVDFKRFTRSAGEFFRDPSWLTFDKFASDSLKLMGTGYRFVRDLLWNYGEGVLGDNNDIIRTAEETGEKMEESLTGDMKEQKKLEKIKAANKEYEQAMYRTFTALRLIFNTLFDGVNADIDAQGDQVFQELFDYRDNIKYTNNGYIDLSATKLWINELREKLASFLNVNRIVYSSAATSQEIQNVISEAFTGIDGGESALRNYETLFEARAAHTTAMFDQISTSITQAQKIRNQIRLLELQIKKMKIARPFKVVGGIFNAAALVISVVGLILIATGVLSPLGVAVLAVAGGLSRLIGSSLNYAGDKYANDTVHDRYDPTVTNKDDENEIVNELGEEQIEKTETGHEEVDYGDIALLYGRLTGEQQVQRLMMKSRKKLNSILRSINLAFTGLRGIRGSNADGMMLEAAFAQEMWEFQLITSNIKDYVDGFNLEKDQALGIKKAGWTLGFQSILVTDIGQPLGERLWYETTAEGKASRHEEDESNTAIFNQPGAGNSASPYGYIDNEEQQIYWELFRNGMVGTGETSAGLFINQNSESQGLNVNYIKKLQDQLLSLSILQESLNSIYETQQKIANAVLQSFGFSPTEATSYSDLSRAAFQKRVYMLNFMTSLVRERITIENRVNMAIKDYNKSREKMAFAIVEAAASVAGAQIGAPADGQVSAYAEWGGRGLSLAGQTGNSTYDIVYNARNADAGYGAMNSYKRSRYLERSAGGNWLVNGGALEIDLLKIENQYRALTNLADLRETASGIIAEINQVAAGSAGVTGVSPLGRIAYYAQVMAQTGIQLELEAAQTVSDRHNTMNNYQRALLQSTLAAAIKFAVAMLMIAGEMSNENDGTGDGLLAEDGVPAPKNNAPGAAPGSVGNTPELLAVPAATPTMDTSAGGGEVSSADKAEKPNGGKADQVHKPKGLNGYLKAALVLQTVSVMTNWISGLVYDSSVTDRSVDKGTGTQKSKQRKTDLARAEKKLKKAKTLGQVMAALDEVSAMFSALAGELSLQTQADQVRENQINEFVSAAQALVASVGDYIKKTANPDGRAKGDSLTKSILETLAPGWLTGIIDAYKTATDPEQKAAKAEAAAAAILKLADKEGAVKAAFEFAASSPEAAVAIKNALINVSVDPKASKENKELAAIILSNLSGEKAANQIEEVERLKLRVTSNPAEVAAVLQAMGVSVPQAVNPTPSQPQAAPSSTVLLACLDKLEQDIEAKMAESTSTAQTTATTATATPRKLTVVPTEVNDQPVEQFTTPQLKTAIESKLIQREQLNQQEKAVIDDFNAKKMSTAERNASLSKIKGERVEISSAISALYRELGNRATKGENIQSAVREIEELRATLNSISSVITTGQPAKISAKALLPFGVVVSDEQAITPDVAKQIMAAQTPEKPAIPTKAISFSRTQPAPATKQPKAPLPAVSQPPAVVPPEVVAEILGQIKKEEKDKLENKSKNTLLVGIGSFKKKPAVEKKVDVVDNNSQRILPTMFGNDLSFSQPVPQEVDNPAYLPAEK
ncbi:MAG: hypothetical protein PHH14_05365 [Candidatus Margulisbacteria bacterium]|nr:hypothetical protein [Candidatus Margulisiibacteriota bacterium]